MIFFRLNTLKYTTNKGDSDVGLISSYRIYASCFPAMISGKLWEMFVIVTSPFQYDSDNIDSFGTNWFDCIPITWQIFTEYTVVSQIVEVVMWPQIAVTSLPCV